MYKQKYASPGAVAIAIAIAVQCAWPESILRGEKKAKT